MTNLPSKPFSVPGNKFEFIYQRMPFHSYLMKFCFCFKFIWDQGFKVWTCWMFNNLSSVIHELIISSSQLMGRCPFSDDRVLLHYLTHCKNNFFRECITFRCASRTCWNAPLSLSLPMNSSIHMGQFLQGGKNGHLMSFFF